MLLRFIQSIAICLNLILCGVVAQGFGVWTAVALAVTMCIGIANLPKEDGAKPG